MSTNGSATINADVLTTQATFPMNFPVEKTNEVVFDILEEMDCRVAGGTMSTSATMRSINVSFSGMSDDMDDKEAVEPVLDGDDEA